MNKRQSKKYWKKILSHPDLDEAFREYGRAIADALFQLKSPLTEFLLVKGRQEANEEDT